MIKLTRPTCPNPNALRTNYKNPENKDALRQASSDKCMYCESKISHIYYGDVEHIKPKETYPQFEFVWENLGYVCAKCNGKKLNKYDDNCPYINPYEESPADFIAPFGELLRQFRGNERGEYTILEIDLNRSELAEKRLNRMRVIANLIDKINRTQNVTFHKYRSSFPSFP